MWCATCDVLPLKQYPARVRAIYTGYEIQQSRFAGTVGAHQTHDFTCLNLKSHIFYRHYTTEPLVYPVDRQDRCVQFRYLSKLPVSNPGKILRLLRQEVIRWQLPPYHFPEPLKYLGSIVPARDFALYHIKPSQAILSISCTAPFLWIRF